MSEEEKKDEKVQLLERVFGTNKERDLFILQAITEGFLYSQVLNTVNDGMPKK